MIKIIKKNLRLIYNFLNLSHRKQTKSPEKNNLPQSKKRTPLLPVSNLSTIVKKIIINTVMYNLKIFIFLINIKKII